MVKRYENHGDPRLPLGLFVHESDYEALAARLAEAERLLRGADYNPTTADESPEEWYTIYNRLMATADSASVPQGESK